MLYPYETLEVAEDANQKEIKRCYHRKIREYPPEKQPAKFQEVVKSYQLVKNETERARLRVFGMPGDIKKRKLSDLVAAPGSSRNKVGVKSWLSLLR